MGSSSNLFPKVFQTLHWMSLINKWTCKFYAIIRLLLHALLQFQFHQNIPFMFTLRYFYSKFFWRLLSITAVRNFRNSSMSPSWPLRFWLSIPRDIFVFSGTPCLLTAIDLASRSISTDWQFAGNLKRRAFDSLKRSNRSNKGTPVMTLLTAVSASSRVWLDSILSASWSSCC